MHQSQLGTLQTFSGSLLDGNELNLERRRGVVFRKPVRPHAQTGSKLKQWGTALPACMLPWVFGIVLFAFDCAGSWLMRVSPWARSLSLSLQGRFQASVCRQRPRRGEDRLTGSYPALPANQRPQHCTPRGPSRGVRACSFGCVAKQSASF